MLLTGPSDPSCSLISTTDTSTACGFLPEHGNFKCSHLFLPSPPTLSHTISSPPLPSPFFPFCLCPFLPISPSPQMFGEHLLSATQTLVTCLNSRPSHPRGDTDNKQTGEKADIAKSLLLFVVPLYLTVSHHPVFSSELGFRTAPRRTSDPFPPWFPWEQERRVETWTPVHQQLGQSLAPGSDRPLPCLQMA